MCGVAFIVRHLCAGGDGEDCSWQGVAGGESGGAGDEEKVKEPFPGVQAKVALAARMENCTKDGNEECSAPGDLRG